MLYSAMRILNITPCSNLCKDLLFNLLGKVLGRVWNPPATNTLALRWALKTMNKEENW